MAGLLMSLASGHVPAVETAQSVTLVADVWCPYNCAPDSVEQGYLIDIATLVFSRLGKHIDYRVMPGRGRSMRSRRNGRRLRWVQPGQV